MTVHRTLAPPRLARWLLRRALDGPARSAIVGDLDEEFSRFVLPRLGARAARRWYWRQAMASIVACLREPAASRLEPAERITVGRALMQDRHGLGTDLRAATRFCWRHPLLSLTVVLTLAAGIGVNAAVFSVLNATYLKKLPIANADRFVSIDAKEGGSFTYPEYLALRDLPGLHALIAGGRTSTTLGAPVEDGRPRQRVVIDMVTANYFDALGVGAGTRGRLFTEADGEPRRPPVVVLSDVAWRKRFGSDSSTIGRTDPSSSRALHHRRRCPGRFHGYANRLQPGHLGSADTGSSHRRQHRDAWTGLGVAGAGRSARTSRFTGNGIRRTRQPMEGGASR